MKKRIAAILAVAICLTACGKATVEPPALLEPAALNESYRSVDYGNIGNVNVEYGCVVPTEYACFFTTNTVLDEIRVSVGDYVEEGMVLATANYDSTISAVNSLQNQISQLRQVQGKKDEISEYTIQKLEAEIEISKLNQEAETEEELLKQVAMEKENHRFDSLMLSHQIQDLNKALAKQNELLVNRELVAPHSGTVSYVRSLGNGSAVSAENNVVVITDYEDSYVELSSTIEKNYEKRYPYVFALMGGERYPLTYYGYSANEKLVATSQSTFPSIRLNFEQKEKQPEVGSYLPILLYENLVQDVLVVGLDSLMSDSGGDYVYVLNGNKQEKRYITLGVRDKKYSEVKDGLTRGELVSYSQEALLPYVYDEKSIELENYQENIQIKGYNVAACKNIQVLATVEGTIEEVYAAEGKTVAEGMVLCTIKTNSGGASLAELTNQIASADENYKQEVEATKASRQELVNQLEDLKYQMEHPATDTDATLPYQKQSLECELAILDLQADVSAINYNQSRAELSKSYQEMTKHNNGNGLYSIVADQNGVVKNIALHAGKNVKVGEKLMGIELSEQYQMEINGQVPLAGKVSFAKEGDANAITGKVVGYTGILNGKVNVTTVKDKVYITTSNSENAGSRSIVQFDSNETLNSLKQGHYNITTANSIKQVVLIPQRAVGIERDMVSSKDDLYFVWKKVDDRIEKQYIDMIYVSVDGSSYALCLGGLLPGDTIIVEKEVLQDATDSSKN